MVETATQKGHSFLAGGGEMGELTRQYDWSKTSLGTPHQWSQSLRATLGIMLNARFPMFLWWGNDLIQFYNDAYRPSLGNSGKHPLALGQKAEECWPETWPVIKPLIDQVLAGGEATWSEDQLIPIYRNNTLEDVYWTFSYSPVKDESGQTAGVLVICTGTTNTVTQRNELETAQQQLLSLFEESPVAIAIISSDNLTFRMANPFYGQLTGRKPDELIGKPMLEVMPELRGQGFDQLLEQVIATGIPYIASEVAVDVVRATGPETIYVDVTYQPQRETIGTGSITGVLVVCTDVTQQVLARQKIEQAEEQLQGAIELAELSTWSLNVQTGVFQYSQRFMNWLGFSDDTKSLDEAYNPLPDEYRQSVADAVAAAIQPGSSGFYRNEHPIINRLTGQVRIISAQARLFYDIDGKPAFLSGTAQDITQQRQLQLALEQQVQQRTEELERVNAALAANLEQYATLNKALEEANALLLRSNDNLERFAYVASHDLQEPLRKVHQFGDLLKTRYIDSLSEELTYIERMQSAASRMSTLIRDLLSFSRISTQQDTRESVSLNEIVATVRADFDMVIAETGAVVDVESLPTVSGDPLQLTQLVHNLVSNALKFRRVDESGMPVIPHIQIRCQLVEAGSLPDLVKPVRTVGTYYRIDVIDNGIGFDEKYTDRIFQVFQRLHSKNQFAGTGIGLAICEKVAINHGGAITARSQLGRGTTFSVYLPK